MKPDSGGVAGLSRPLEGPATPPESGLLLVAHGSRDTRHAVTIGQIAAATRAARPHLEVRVGYLDHDGPRVPDALAAFNTGRVAAVPLLLGHAYHGRIDVPAALAEGSRRTGVRVDLAAVLGPDPRLLPAASRAVRNAAGTSPDGDSGLVLACAGTTDPDAKAALARLALRWRRALGCDVRVADAAATGPGVGETVEALRAAGAARVDVAAWFLAPGLLLDRASAAAIAAGADSVAAPLGAAPEVVATVLRRLDAVATRAARVA
ncbi:MAG TPA: CbiX/SirB N-terminal domain-containing protein [Sporichthya sp.]|nr:CbiX/SirB N-terminal domain-containing protein [Sporichthya sp.]